MNPHGAEFEQAVEKLREAMDRSTSGLRRMRLIDEALALYHAPQQDDGGRAPTPGEDLEDRPSV